MAALNSTISGSNLTLPGTISATQFISTDTVNNTQTTLPHRVIRRLHLPDAGRRVELPLHQVERAEPVQQWRGILSDRHWFRLGHLNRHDLSNHRGHDYYNGNDRLRDLCHLGGLSYLGAVDRWRRVASLGSHKPHRRRNDLGRRSDDTRHEV
jgi:hypothetical protein